MEFLGIIPARIGSTRLHGKPLLDIAGKPMIQWVYEAATEALDKVWVATDSDQIKKTVEHFGGNAILTSASHTNGTSRCLEAYHLLQKQLGPIDVVINIQGDEPLLEPDLIKTLKKCYEHEAKTITWATLVSKVTDPKDLDNDSEVFVTLDQNHFALYFSRSVIPYIKEVPRKEWLKKHDFYKHLGLYAYTPQALQTFTQLPPSSLEMAESLEQNRWLEHGEKIKVGIGLSHSIPVDTAQDRERVIQIIQSRSK